jgi:hypothetical protein
MILFVILVIRLFCYFDFLCAILVIFAIPIIFFHVIYHCHPFNILVIAGFEMGLLEKKNIPKESFLKIFLHIFYPYTYYFSFSFSSIPFQTHFFHHWSTHQNTSHIF